MNMLTIFDQKYTDESARDAGILENFDLVVVINLNRRTDRLCEVTDELRKVGLEFAQPQVNRLSASQPSEPGEFVSIGARGCFESHLRILETAVSHGVQSLLIIEDDCDFRGDVAGVMQCLQGTDWDVFYGGHCGTTPVLERDGNSPLVVAPPNTTISGTHCIGLRGQAIVDARDYLQAMYGRKGGDPLGGPMHVDGAYTWFRGAHPDYMTLVARPIIAVQRSSRSDITNKNWFDRVPVVRNLAGLARKLRRK